MITLCAGPSRSSNCPLLAAHSMNQAIAPTSTRLSGISRRRMSMGGGGEGGGVSGEVLPLAAHRSPLTSFEIRKPQRVQHDQQRTGRHADAGDPGRDVPQRGSGDRDEGGGRRPAEGRAGGAGGGAGEGGAGGQGA